MGAAALLSLSLRPLQWPLPYPQYTDRSLTQTRRAPDMDVGRFPTEPGWRIGKSPSTRTGQVCRVEEAVSFGYFSLGQQRKVTRRKAGALALALALAVALACLRKQPQQLSPEGELLFFAGPKKSNQKKRPSPTQLPSQAGAEEIFRFAILAQSENGGHPCPPPYGSG